MDCIKEELGKVGITIEKNYWDINKAYDRLVIVEVKGQRACYISRKPVPIGVPITDRNFWVCFSNLDIELKNDLLALYNKVKSYVEEDIDPMVVRITLSPSDETQEPIVGKVYKEWKYMPIVRIPLPPGTSNLTVFSSYDFEKIINGNITNVIVDIMGMTYQCRVVNTTALAKYDAEQQEETINDDIKEVYIKSDVAYNTPRSYEEWIEIYLRKDSAEERYCEVTRFEFNNDIE